MPRTLAHARTMRRHATAPEHRLWTALRNGGLAGMKWRRQVPFDTMIVDFYCPAHRIAVELDGATHADPATDAARDARLRSRGIDVVHVWNNDVMGNLEGVPHTILAATRGAPPPAGEGKK